MSVVMQRAAEQGKQYRLNFPFPRNASLKRVGILAIEEFLTACFAVSEMVLQFSSVSMVSRSSPPTEFTEFCGGPDCFLAGIYTDSQVLFFFFSILDQSPDGVHSLIKVLIECVEH
ncbi:hypothetical protein KP509_10G076300 [Ceratopteris richardii]|uniref:Uncharacterized protein n=1 Tax=Ceratopteris richardii TaxID=49495 RepID=A0A8T2U0G0_CERRI|nr:hypothetical protein KP509_10G076300 [Ceratopteris richardii]